MPSVLCLKGRLVDLRWVSSLPLSEQVRLTLIIFQACSFDSFLFFLMGIFIESPVVSGDHVMVPYCSGIKNILSSDCSAFVCSNSFPLQMLISFSVPFFPCIVSTSLTQLPYSSSCQNSIKDDVSTEL